MYKLYQLIWVALILESNKHVQSSNGFAMQAVIEANIIGPLIQLLQNAEFDVKKEAAWAISNATSGGTHDQIK